MEINVSISDTSEQPAITVVLVDAQPVVRRGLRAILTRSPRINVVAEAGSSRDAVRLAALHRPDVLVLDVEVQGCHVVTTLREIARITPSTAILIFTAAEDEEAILAAMRAGARGYILKSCTDEGIERAVQGLATGEVILGPNVADRLISLLTSEPAQKQHLFPDLTAREREVLELIAAGMRNSAIASRLHLAPKTISNHISTIFSKLNVADRTEAIEAVRKARLDRNRAGGAPLELVRTQSH